MLYLLRASCCFSKDSKWRSWSCIVHA